MPKRVPDPPPRPTGEEPAEFIDFLPGIDWVDPAPAPGIPQRRTAHPVPQRDQHAPTFHRAEAPATQRTDDTRGAEQLTLLTSLMGSSATVAPDVIQITTGTWVIHGDIPVDRDVILAEFSSYERAATILARALHDDAARRP